MANPGIALLLTNVAATLFMVGVIWVVQVVHYFLFDRVGAAGWAEYHAAHTRLMGGVVLLPMVVELATSGLLALRPPAALSGGAGLALLWAGAVFAVLTWAVTFFVSVPLHERLSHGFDAAACRALVSTNWWRTVLWTAHGLVVLEVIRRLLLQAAVRTA